MAAARRHSQAKVNTIPAWPKVLLQPSVHWHLEHGQPRPSFRIEHIRFQAARRLHQAANATAMRLQLLEREAVRISRPIAAPEPERTILRPASAIRSHAHRQMSARMHLHLHLHAHTYTHVRSARTCTQRRARIHAPTCGFARLPSTPEYL